MKPVARELVGSPPRLAGSRSAPKRGTATQSSGSKLPRHSHIAGLKRAALPVGVSLLAIAVCQSTTMLNAIPLSRAGSLLQGFAVHSVFVTGCLRNFY
ncbi:hypothetical protein F7R05_13495 [Pseudomonas koreensis]|nr:hypothetical protein F7R05_13495 [Pseudomonas koreensis]